MPASCPALRPFACCTIPPGTLHVCHTCAKREDQPHDASTRAAHSEHLTRFGWSGMCAAPQS